MSSSCPISAPVSPIIFTPPERTDSLPICKGRSWSDIELSAGCWRQPIYRIFVAGRLDQVGWAATSSSILSRGDSSEIQPVERRHHDGRSRAGRRHDCDVAEGQVFSVWRNPNMWNAQWLDCHWKTHGAVARTLDYGVSALQVRNESHRIAVPDIL
jgi:hypothetical protein